MVDYTYVECTSAVMQALKHFSDKYPQYRGKEIRSVHVVDLEYIVHGSKNQNYSNFKLTLEQYLGQVTDN